MGAIGAFGPFLGLALGRQGASAASVGLLLALVPATRLLVTPAWALVADRFRLGTRILQLASALSMVTAGVLAAGLGGLPGAGLALIAFAIARAPVAPVLDALTVRSLEQRGADPLRYGRIRLWGSLGFLMSAGVASLLADRVAWSAAPIALAAGIWGVGTLVTLRLPAAEASGPVPLRPALRALSSRPGFLWLLPALALHGAGLNAYDAWYAVHLDALGLAGVWTGAAIVVGVSAEMAVMFAASRLVSGRDPLGLLTLAMGTATVRWALIATLTNPWLLTALQLSHGAVFGLFWVGGVETFRRWAPGEVRASAQSLLLMAAYGAGPLLASGTAALVVDAHGTDTLFRLAAGGCAVGTVLALMARRAAARA